MTCNGYREAELVINFISMQFKEMQGSIYHMVKRSFGQYISIRNTYGETFWFDAAT